MRPKFFYFDLGNVLLYFDHGIAFRRMASIAETSEEKMREIVMQGGLQTAYETGHISGGEFIQRIGTELNRDLPTDSMLLAAADMFVPNPHILPVIERVAGLGIPFGILSNTCEAHWEWIKAKRYPQVLHGYSHVILSYEEKSMKPDHGIYLAAEKLAGVAPEEIFFTDDREENIEAAKARGWQTDLFVNADRLMKAIDQF